MDMLGTQLFVLCREGCPLSEVILYGMWGTFKLSDCNCPLSECPFHCDHIILQLYYMQLVTILLLYGCITMYHALIKEGPYNATAILYLM